MSLSDFVPFGSKVLYRLPPGVKPEKDEGNDKEGYYLGPSMDIPMGSIMISVEKPNNIDTYTTVRPIIDDKQPIFFEAEQDLPGFEIGKCSDEWEVGALREVREMETGPPRGP